MTKNNRYILIGCGGFAVEIAEYINSLDRSTRIKDQRHVVSDVVSTSSARFEDLCSVLGYEPDFHQTPNLVSDVCEKESLICIGSPEDRHKNFTNLKGLGFTFGTLVHETALVAKSAKIGEGSIICPYAFIGAMASIGANSVVNVRATVGHDVRVGVSSVLSPHCNMNGASKCGRVSFIGAGAILDPSSAIGDYSKISSGAVLKQKFGDGFLLAGSPAKGRQMFKVENA